jgi:sugar phosphate permease
VPPKGINFISAWKVPGVLGYSLSYLCLKFSAYGLMLWLPSYVSQKQYNYSDYDKAWASSTIDIGNICGSISLGLLTDLTYSKRAPILVLAIVFAAIFHVILALTDPTIKPLFYTICFITGVLAGGSVGIVSAVSVADIVRND